MPLQETLVPDYSEEIDDNPLALRRHKENTHPLTHPPQARLYKQLYKFQINIVLGWSTFFLITIREELLHI